MYATVLQTQSIWGRILCWMWLSAVTLALSQGAQCCTWAVVQSQLSSLGLAARSAQVWHTGHRTCSSPVLCWKSKLRGEAKNDPNAPQWAKLKSHIAKCLPRQQRSHTESVLHIFVQIFHIFPYICPNLQAETPLPFIIILPPFMFVQVLIIPSCKGLMHLQKPAFAFIYKTFVCLHFQDSTCFARHLCGTWGTQKINITAIRDKISDQRPLLAATKVSESSSSYRQPGHHSKTGQSSAV